MPPSEGPAKRAQDRRRWRAPAASNQLLIRRTTKGVKTKIQELPEKDAIEPVLTLTVQTFLRTR